MTWIFHFQLLLPPTAATHRGNCKLQKATSSNLMRNQSWCSLIDFEWTNNRWDYQSNDLMEYYFRRAQIPAKKTDCKQATTCLMVKLEYCVLHKSCGVDENKVNFFFA